jgi:hypothetical protein
MSNTGESKIEGESLDNSDEPTLIASNSKNASISAEQFDKESYSHLPKEIRDKILKIDSKLEKYLDSEGNWKFKTNKSDIAGALKEVLWSTFNPSQAKAKSAENNIDFALQFLLGSGKHIQEHYKKSDPVLQDFKTSPGAAEIRRQYDKMGHPAFTDKLGYGTLQAALETIPPQRVSPVDMATSLPGDPSDAMLQIGENLSKVGFQVGGFGNPPEKYAWARTTAQRCDADGTPNPHGKNVHYQVINLAGMHSFWLHMDIVQDRPIEEHGPQRTIVQTFSWTEPLEKPSKK